MKLSLIFFFFKGVLPYQADRLQPLPNLLGDATHSPASSLWLLQPLVASQPGALVHDHELHLLLRLVSFCPAANQTLVSSCPNRVENRCD